MKAVTSSYGQVLKTHPPPALPPLCNPQYLLKKVVMETIVLKKCYDIDNASTASSQRRASWYRTTTHHDDADGSTAIASTAAAANASANARAAT